MSALAKALGLPIAAEALSFGDAVAEDVLSEVVQQQVHAWNNNTGNLVMPVSHLVKPVTSVRWCSEALLGEGDRE
jgi:hypothetical protein